MFVNIFFFYLCRVDRLACLSNVMSVSCRVHQLDIEMDRFLSMLQTTTSCK